MLRGLPASIYPYIFFPSPWEHESLSAPFPPVLPPGQRRQSSSVPGLTMSEQSHVNSLFLNEDAAKRLHAEGRVQRLRQAVQKRAARAKKRMSSITADSAKSFFRRNAFVLFTIAAVLLGMGQRWAPGVSVGESLFIP